MDPTPTAPALPPVSGLSRAVISFLDGELREREALSLASDLVAGLETQCRDLDRSLVELRSRLEVNLAAYSSFSDRVHGSLGGISAKFVELLSLVGPFDSLSDGGGGRKILGEELPALAKEVARVEMVRAYAETALKLDSLIGDVEEAVSSTLKRKHSFAQSSEEVRMHAIRTLNEIEGVTTQVSKLRPRWTHLVCAIDHRIDRALAILRPQAVADHRAFLASLGWPPPLSASTSANPDAGRLTAVPNPLLTMQGDLKRQYCENFLSLCHLQQLQRRRRSRQLEGRNREIALHQPLWAIEELITRDYVDSMDELLQPLVDEAMLAGYSCREEWITSMVSALSTYLAKEIFPLYASQLEEESITGVRSKARTSWLHLIDLMISFDKQIRSLIANSGISFSLMDESNLQKLSSLSVFCDRPDWLELWAAIELSDTLDKLKADVDNERNWTKKVQGVVLVSGPEDFRSPLVSDFFLRRLSSVVDRSRSLPNIPLRSKFLKLVGAPIILKFLDCLLVRCQEAEGLTALTDDSALIKVANSVNAARYVESVLREWCEDVFFIEMGLRVGDEPGKSQAEEGDFDGTVYGPGSGVFDKEIWKLEEFIVEWVEKISVVVLRGFDVSSRDYIRNRKQWQGKSEEGSTVSRTLVDALDHLQGKMSIIEESLNGMDFVMVWRKVAEGLDQSISNGLLLSNMKFYDGGIERLSSDMEVLFGVFRAWCLRPEGFFLRVCEGLKLLRMGEKQVKDILAGGLERLKEEGISHLRVFEAEKIAKNRVFTS
ncbi:RINT1-like protein MAG2 isoform X2 [Rhodamnia argentea]|uniref:RINT1-like protein MAG2 isoform X2 n=1 Tax=Rhodamnia argentea TaxID=178133 RepID=A0A8B8NFW7_9MYRT|nr:RINT1-like protein MAG2 isoform X2 [Rhodamnia argentea]